MADKLVRILTLKQGKDWPTITRQMLADAWRWQKDIVVKISPNQESRSVKQNRLLWLWHSELSRHIEEHMGEIYDTEDIHEYVTGKLLPKRVVIIHEDPHIMRTRTSKLGVKEFAEFLNRYEAWASMKYECFFTQPSDLYIDALMKQAEQSDGDKEGM